MSCSRRVLPTLKEKFDLYPDFQTGGIIDVQNYNDGMRGGKYGFVPRLVYA